MFLSPYRLFTRFTSHHTYTLLLFSLSLSLIINKSNLLSEQHTPHTPKCRALFLDRLRKIINLKKRKWQAEKDLHTTKSPKCRFATKTNNSPKIFLIVLKRHLVCFYWKTSHYFCVCTISDYSNNFHSKINQYV